MLRAEIEQGIFRDITGNNAAENRDRTAEIRPFSRSESGERDGYPHGKTTGEEWKYEKEWKIENGNSLGNRAWKFGKIGAFWPSGVLGFLRKGCGIAAETLTDQAAARQVWGLRVRSIRVHNSCTARGLGGIDTFGRPKSNWTAEISPFSRSESSERDDYTHGKTTGRRTQH